MLQPTEPIELEIFNIGEQLKTLRLPHKLNHYRQYENRLTALRKQAEKVPCAEQSKSYKTQIEKLQDQLDSTVLCGVNQCFLCSLNQIESPKLPVYKRSVSASFTQHSYNRCAQSAPGYSKQVSHYETTSSRDSMATEFSSLPITEASVVLPATSYSQTISEKININSNNNNNKQMHSGEKTDALDKVPNDNENGNEHNDDANHDDSKHDGTEHDDMDSEKERSNSTNFDMQSQKVAAASASLPAADDRDQCAPQLNQVSTSPTLPPPATNSRNDIREKSSASINICRITGHGQSTATKGHRVGPPFQNNSYRAYKDFVNHYAGVANRNNANQVSDKRAA